MNAENIVRWVAYPLLVIIIVMIWTNQNDIDIAAMIGAAGGVAFVGLVLAAQRFFLERKKRLEKALNPVKPL